MAISGQQVASSSTLETLRTQFNNLVTDVAGLEGGSISYTTLNTTTKKATTVEVKEDGPHTALKKLLLRKANNIDLGMIKSKSL